MAKDENIEIRTLPRTSKAEKPKAAPSRRGVIGVGLASLLLLAFTILSPTTPRSSSQQRKLSSPATTHPPRSFDSVNRHLEDASMKQQILQHAVELDSLRTKGADLELNALADEGDRNQGVQLDQENTAEKVYADLTENEPTNNYNELLPADKINARLANRQWVNEVERAERIQFVRNYIRAWAERGYEVQIDQNLVVVGLKKLSRVQKVNIDQIMDRMALKGR